MYIIYVFKYTYVDIHEISKIIILQREKTPKANWQVMRKNGSWLFISLSEDLEDLDANSQVWCSPSKDHFFKKRNPNIRRKQRELYDLHFCGNEALSVDREVKLQREEAKKVDGHTIERSEHREDAVCTGLVAETGLDFWIPPRILTSLKY